MLRKPLQCSCQAQFSIKCSNSISDHEISFEIKHTIKYNSGSNWENLKHIELQPIYPYAFKKRVL